ncbi:MAG: spore protease YyaC, partial [Syntrophomonadaceae bacterium]|nr:spore protease YyaC [Syntrophomonadaceae bacterium]
MEAIYRRAFDHPAAERELAALFAPLFVRYGEELVFICIGTDKNLLDCLGPLVGTMLKEQQPGLKVYGTLQEPLHARNMVGLLQRIAREHPAAFAVAVDACLGKPEEIGIIEVREGSLHPGRALQRSLPPVGRLALTGTVAALQSGRDSRSLARGSFTPVYFMARLIARA